MDVRNNGARNHIALPPDVGGTVEIRGDDNAITVGPVFASGLVISVGSGNRIQIAEGCNLGDLFVYAGDGASVHIGPGTGFNARVRLLLHEPRTISIGAGCLFGGDTDITVSDMHSIVDEQTGRRINPARDIRIGDRVWIGWRCIVLKGATIEEGSIIGAGAVVTGHIPARCLAVGVPAKVTKTSVTWRYELLPDEQ